MNLRRHKSFVRFWIASTASYFGTYITSLALQVLVVVNLHGTAVDVGWVNASGWLPYVLLGLAVGVLIDRIHRKLVLVVTDIGRGILLTMICLTAVFDVISIGWLMVIMILFGILSIFNDAAYQSLVPEIVPRPLLIRANARLEQSAEVAETSGLSHKRKRVFRKWSMTIENIYSDGENNAINNINMWKKTNRKDLKMLDFEKG
ncbi:hypothetical protein CIL05_10795 [Virgibacillus profundi]|uniref:Major facilitator superfamily (MFS) profile domain-containing protein n=1 Tax=Virgibacillus profundi TaxID=2024555 RepID=A0A2A2IDK7_9BACI|nr:MFS transporter [Virgibacillus profundi]PAV29354.1 hypothetical protein CIL05_10795 [Virgibacillus profundi]PXY53522.1 MFS transporter [Virgibacillus profundi]